MESLVQSFIKVFIRNYLKNKRLVERKQKEVQSATMTDFRKL